MINYNPTSATSIIDAALCLLVDPRESFKADDSATSDVQETLQKLRDDLKEKIYNDKVPVSEKQDRRIQSNTIDAFIAKVEKSKALQAAIVFRYSKLGPYDVSGLHQLLLGGDHSNLEEIGQALITPAPDSVNEEE